MYSLIRHTKGPGKCVGLYRMSEYSGFILVYRNNFGSINFYWFWQDVRKLRCRIAQVPLYIHICTRKQSCMSNKNVNWFKLQQNFVIKKLSVKITPDTKMKKIGFYGLVVFNATLNNISTILWRSFIGGGNRRTWSKPQTLFSFEAENRRISPAIAIKSPAMNFPSMG